MRRVREGVIVFIFCWLVHWLVGCAVEMCVCLRVAKEVVEKCNGEKGRPHISHTEKHVCEHNLGIAYTINLWCMDT